jgi:hypothetical protein
VLPCLGAGIGKAEWKTDEASAMSGSVAPLRVFGKAQGHGASAQRHQTALIGGPRRHGPLPPPDRLRDPGPVSPLLLS